VPTEAPPTCIHVAAQWKRGPGIALLLLSRSPRQGFRLSSKRRNRMPPALVPCPLEGVDFKVTGTGLRTQQVTNDQSACARHPIRHVPSPKRVTQLRAVKASTLSVDVPRVDCIPVFGARDGPPVAIVSRRDGQRTVRVSTVMDGTRMEPVPRPSGQQRHCRCRYCHTFVGGLPTGCVRPRGRRSPHQSRWRCASVRSVGAASAAEGLSL